MPASTQQPEKPLPASSPARENAEELQRNLFNKLYTKGIFANDQWFITNYHPTVDIEKTLDAMKSAIEEIS
ncbi:MAG: hypothetical protein P8L44_05940 [Opitutales bacterium]|nr:hypothetical protein [Opitutales bacterium]